MFGVSFTRTQGEKLFDISYIKYLKKMATTLLPTYFVPLY